MNSLPIELKTKLFNYLNFEDKINLSYTNIIFRQIFIRINYLNTIYLNNIFNYKNYDVRKIKINSAFLYFYYFKNIKEIILNDYLVNVVNNNILPEYKNKIVSIEVTLSDCCDFNYLQYLSNLNELYPNLKHLKIYIEELYPEDFDDNCLSCENINYDGVFYIDLPLLKLESLYICNDSYDIDFKLNTTYFISEHSINLKILKLNGINNIDYDMSNYNLPNLEKLKIVCVVNNEILIFGNFNKLEYLNLQLYDPFKKNKITLKNIPKNIKVFKI